MIERFIWDLTYACPLRCQHCYSESGRRPASLLGREDMRKVMDVILAAKPKRISFSGGEPLMAPWWAEAARGFHDARIPVTLFTSGWFVDDAAVQQLADCVASVCVSVDGPDAATHDYIRGRDGAFRHAMAALGRLDAHKGARKVRDEACYTLGIDHTVTRTNLPGIEAFVTDMTTRFPQLDYIRFGAVVPEGLAQEEGFAARELLSMEEVEALTAAEPRLAAQARNSAAISVTDARYFLPTSPLYMASDGIAHIEADGQLRAFTTYEAKVGNVLKEPLGELWGKVQAWRQDPFVLEQLSAIRTTADWARATRALDRRYGSDADKVRLALRVDPVEAAAT